MVLFSGNGSGAAASRWIRLATIGLIISIALQVVHCESEPTESQCRPYIEKALKQQNVDLDERRDEEESPITTEKEEHVPTDEFTETTDEEGRGDLKEEEDDAPSGDVDEETSADDEKEGGETQDEADQETEEVKEESEGEEKTGEETEAEEDETKEETVEEEDKEGETEDEETEVKDEGEQQEDGEGEETEESQKEDDTEEEQAKGDEEEAQEAEEESEHEDKEIEEVVEKETQDEVEGEAEHAEEEEMGEEATEEEDKAEKAAEEEEEEKGEEEKIEGEEKEDEEGEKEVEDGEEVETQEEEKSEGDEEAAGEDEKEVEEGKEVEKEEDEGKEDGVEVRVDVDMKSDQEPEESDAEKEEAAEEGEKGEEEQDKEEGAEEAAEKEGAEESTEGEEEQTPEEDLTKEVTIPENLRPRDHITQILKLDEESVETESVVEKTIDTTLKSLKTLYDNAIKPLEMLYKYRDLSNRHFGDPEIFSKPLILFMGPWSGGKSSTINYLLDNEFTEMSLRTGAEPSPAYFNILMYGEEEEVLDGTQLAADWTFSGLQKFGQSLLDRLKGYKLPSRLLQKVNIVEIPGILEIRKQVQRLFPFNDACQWFIDRADIIFLVYDPSKLDVGPETEAILDQLKGREYQTRIILNKADQVKPEELMRVQGTLIWNISPLMSSSEPPIMYTTSLWSLPYENGAPTRLLLAQERAFLRDLREAIDKRVDNKIASARRFAVRVRNHAKMVDCYLTTYYNHKTFFGNKKKISDDIIENPQKYHIYEGLSTLTNISRYDLPDPDVYRDFFKLNPLYDFTKLSDTCTYFRGCPINTLDVAIAYDLPELVGKYKKVLEASKAQASQKTNS